MGCGSSTEAKQQQQQQQQKQKSGPKGNQKKLDKKKSDFAGVKSIDLTDDESVYGQTNRSKPDTSRFPNGIAYIYGFKAKLKQHLKECTERGNLEKVEESIAVYEKYDGPEDDDYFRALSRRHFLQLQRGLRDGIRRRHAGTLSVAIDKAQNSPFHVKLKTHIEAATKLRDHIVELEIHTHDILDMEQKTISEIKSYQRPPECIFYTMKATYVLIGTEGEKIRDWGDIQALMNQTVRNALMHRIDHFDLDEANLEHAEKAANILNRVEYGDVLKASNGVAIFYLWTDQNIKQIKQDNKNNNSKNTNKRKKK